MGNTIAEKILSEKSESDARAGDIIIERFDLAFIQDTTGLLTVRQFQAAHFKKLADSPKAAVFLDHTAPSQSREMSNDHTLLRQFAREMGALLHDIGDGVCHQLVAESLARPGSPASSSAMLSTWGLPVLICNTKEIVDGDMLEIDLQAGIITDKTNGRRLTFGKIPEVMLRILDEGGILPYIEKHGDIRLYAGAPMTKIHNITLIPGDGGLGKGNIGLRMPGENFSEPDHPSAHTQALAGHVVTQVCDKEFHHLGDVIRCCQPSQCHLRYSPLPDARPA